MRVERLLERIRYISMGVQPPGSETARLIASVARYLTLLLNTQQGSAQIATDFGMPDFNQTRFGNGLDNLRGLERVIGERILKYEPRVKQLQVTFIPQEDNPLALIFHIKLHLRHPQAVLPVVFETVLDADGHISVQGT